MKMTNVFLFTLFILVITNGSFNVISSKEVSRITPRINTSNSLIANEKNVDILQVTRSGPIISVVLDYNLSSTARLDTNETLAVLVIFSQSTQEDSLTIQAALLFFHTIEDQFFLFWMLGDPYSQAQNWQSGVENEHYKIDDALLTLTFIEFLGVGNLETETTVLAKITSFFEGSDQINDFRMVLDEFRVDLPLSFELPTIEPTTESTTSETTTEEESTTTTTTTTTTEPFFTSGMTTFFTIGVLLSIFIIKRFGKK
jgi:hypothetical protein